MERKTLAKEKLKNLELHYQHPPYELEKKLFREIKDARLESAIATLKTINGFERATLSKNSLRSLKNSLIGSCTIFSRAALSSGASTENVFALSDIVIQHIEYLDDIQGLVSFEYEMLEEFILLIRRFSMKGYSKPVATIMRTIQDNASKNLTIPELASFTGKSSDYMSKLFKKETGMSITEYYQKIKIDTSKSELELTSLSITDISMLLGFCNSGYFTNVFKKHEGITPEQYRKVLENEL